jgi:type IV pilus assembly protein PilA
MFKQVHNQKGFTLIELMIVVAIIGILAAIAIPNFLTYQMKSRQSEARTNLGGIRTSELSFNGERGCFLAVTLWPAGAPAAGTSTGAVAWGVLAPTAGAQFCTVPPGGAGNGVDLGVFTDMGYAATGNIRYRYAVNTVSNPANVVTPLVPGAGVCVAGGVPGASGGVLVGTSMTNNGFQATASSNLDGDGTVSTFGGSDAAGVIECTPGGTF